MIRIIRSSKYANRTKSFTAEEIGRSIYNIAPDIASDLEYGGIDGLMSLDEFVDYLHDQVEVHSDELEFDSEEDEQQWIDSIIQSSIFNKKSATPSKVPVSKKASVSDDTKFKRDRYLVDSVIENYTSLLDELLGEVMGIPRSKYRDYLTVEPFGYSGDLYRVIIDINNEEFAQALYEQGYTDIDNPTYFRIRQFMERLCDKYGLYNDPVLEGLAIGMLKL